MPKKQPSPGWDRHPQLGMAKELTASAANAWTTAEIDVPQPVAPLDGNKAQLVEILKVYFFMPDTDNDANAQLYLMTQDEATEPAPSKNTVLAAAKEENTLTTSGAQALMTWPVTVDLTDGNGNGMLIAQNKLYFGLGSAAYAAAATGYMKCLWRYRQVEMAEFVGIAQQQAS